MAYEFKEKLLTEELKKKIHDGFNAHCLQTVGVSGFENDIKVFEIWLDGDFVGTVSCNMGFGAMRVRYLLVEEKYRGKGFGKILMEKVLDYGKKKGCVTAHVDTMNFQAPDFYRKLGFQLDFVRTGFKHGVSVYCFSKRLEG